MKTLQQNKWAWATIACFILFVASFSYAVSLQISSETGAAAESGAAARVNGVDIPKSDVYDALLAYDGGQTLSGLIDEELVRQAAEEAGVEITDADVEAELESVRSQFGSEDEYLSALAMYGMTEEDVKSDMLIQVRLRKILEPQITITDEQIAEYFEANAESLGEPEQVKASHILVATKEEAEDIRRQLAEGTDFAALAAEKSSDETTAATGGDLGYFGRGEMETAFEEAAFALEVGRLSEPVETSYGFHIIQVSEKKAAVPATLEAKREEIRSVLISRELGTLSATWLEEQRTNAEIATYM